MKIIDVKKKGNVVRLYLGDDNLKDWYGDDWNDRGCDCTVYNEFISKTIDITFPFNDEVVSLFDFYVDQDNISKDMMKSKIIPLFAVCYNVNDYSIYSKDSLSKWKDKFIIFMGDNWEDVKEDLLKHCSFVEGDK